MKLVDVVFAAILMNMLIRRPLPRGDLRKPPSLNLPDTTITLARL